jgi:phage terminase large subunit-like protein
MEDGTFKTLRRLWIPEDGLKDKELKDNVPYTAWINAGYITAIPGQIIDYEFVKRQIFEDCDFFRIREIAVDPWNANQIVCQLIGEGLPIVECRQGFRTMSEPSKDYEALIISEKLHYQGDPVSDWMISNLMWTRDAAGNIKPDKSKPNYRIDGPVSHIMALGRAIFYNEIDINEHFQKNGGIFG